MKTYQINPRADVAGVKTAQVLALAVTLATMPIDQQHTTEQIATYLASDKSLLTTRQDPIRIFSYYIRELKSIGIISEVEQERAVKLTRHDFIEGLGI